MEEKPFWIPDDDAPDAPKSRVQARSASSKSTRSRDKHRPAWVTAIIGVIAVGVFAGSAYVFATTLSNVLHPSQRGALASLGISQHPAAPKTHLKVTLKVVGTGTGKVQTVVNFGTKSESKSAVLRSLPWQKTYKVKRKDVDGATFTVTGHNHSSTQPLKAEILVDGKVVSSATRDGKYALVTTTKTLSKSLLGD